MNKTITIKIFLNNQKKKKKKIRTYDLRNCCKVNLSCLFPWILHVYIQNKFCSNRLQLCYISLKLQVKPLPCLS